MDDIAQVFQGVSIPSSNHWDVQGINLFTSMVEHSTYSPKASRRGDRSNH
jgi:hypothetical protein